LTIQQEELGAKKQNSNVKHYWVEQETEKSEFGIQHENGYYHRDHHAQ